MLTDKARNLQCSITKHNNVLSVLEETNEGIIQSKCNGNYHNVPIETMRDGVIRLLKIKIQELEIEYEELGKEFEGLI